MSKLNTSLAISILLAKAYRERKTGNDSNIVNPIHIFQHILSPAFHEDSMAFQPVKQRADQLHLLTNYICMEHAAQKLLKHKKHTQSEQVKITGIPNTHNPA